MMKYEFKCLRCGDCCRAGLEISIRREDILNWLQAGKNDFNVHVQIDSKSISSEGLAGYHIEEQNALMELLKVNNKEDYEIKKKELQEFILKNHDYLGKGMLPLPIYSFIETLDRMPILVPRTLEVVLEGIKRGIAYILKYKSDRRCPFQQDNLCRIQEIKPKDCKRFPYKEDGSLKTDNYILKICKGIKSSQEKER